MGAAPLAGNADLNNYARWWAREMAVSGNFAHSDIGSLLGPWSIVGENIGYGPAVETVFQALVNSSGHYNNMVDTRFTSVGVGVFVDTSGRIWTAHVFAG
ncbi:MAG TPA: CAP domain-containing protein [Acidimicrobiia bacterium]